jgi:membrane-bound lytic murein transglycosylase D
MTGLRVTFEAAPGQRRDLDFSDPFLIGRVDECQVAIQNDYVSRKHAEVFVHEGTWWIRDLGSRNGIVINGERVQQAPITETTTLRLGVEGPFVRLAVLQPAPVAAPEVDRPAGSETIVAHYIDRYFAKPADGEPVGEHTMMVRQAFSRVQAKQKRKYGWIVGGLAVLVLAIGGIAIYQTHQASQQKAMAEELFYAMKSLDVDIANVQRLVMETNNERGIAEMRKYQERRKEMEKNYDRFVTALKVYDTKVTPEERLILRVARIFGECELAAPPDFISEVRSYIQKWQGSARYRNAIRRAQENGYIEVITKELLDQGLPPQFFYLAMQESDFDPFISGPKTYKGFAKGMWQFIPETGAKYGLRIGPLVEFPRPDTSDDRHNWRLATHAAARYLKDIYTMEAQASGMLVMACYNWGEHRVLPLVRTLPANPRDRNFWRLLTSYREKVPDETYKYVFYIISAAVIGENPRMFGFDFDNPLGHLDAQ